MPFQKSFTKNEIKLDSFLSLVYIAQENQRNGIDIIYSQYGLLFDEELDKIQSKLYEDGLIEYSVGTGGIEIQLTNEGRAFSLIGGYAGSPDIPRIRNKKKFFKKIYNWIYIVVAGFFIVLFFCLLLNHSKG